jgi:hypothetical protein
MLLVTSFSIHNLYNVHNSVTEKCTLVHFLDLRIRVVNIVQELLNRFWSDSVWSDPHRNCFFLATFYEDDDIESALHTLVS